jgi:GTPase
MPEYPNSEVSNSEVSNSEVSNSEVSNSEDPGSEFSGSEFPPASSLTAQLDDAIFSFDDIQADLNYRQAQVALREMIAKLDLSERERQGLEANLAGLDTLVQKLDQQVVYLAVFGMVGRGKSSLLNALLGEVVFETGPIHGVTRTSERANWNISQESITGSDRPLLRVSLPSVGQSRIELIDTPGIDEVDGESREILARNIAQQADLILFIISGDITNVEYQALAQLRDASKPMLLVFNKIDQYPEADRQQIYAKIRDERVKEILSPNEIVMAAASPLVARAVRRQDGSVGAQLQPGPPLVEDLKLKILEILHREGKSLVALNTMLFADEVNQQVLQRKLEIREQSANRLIWNSVIAKSVAIALNPITVLDTVGSAAVDVTMIVALSKLYGIAMTQSGAVELLKKIALAMGGITASELLATLGLGSLKSLLGIAAPATGGLTVGVYLSVAATQAGVAGVSTYGIGQVTKSYLANGASWGPDGPKAVVDRILTNLDEASILSRIREELRAKVDLTQKRRTQK